MNLHSKMKTRNAKGNPVTAILAVVFVMFVVSGLLLLLLAAVLYKAEPSESVVRIGIVAIYIIAGFLGGLLMGKMMREQKFLWGLAAGAIYFVILFLASAAVKRGFDMQLAKVFTTFVLCAASGMAGGMVS